VAVAVFAAGGALGDALMRLGHVVVHSVFGQDGEQVGLAEDQHAVQELTAQGAGEALADRVHPRSLDGSAQDTGVGGLEGGVERCSEVRSVIADQEPDALEPLAEGEGKVAGLLHCPVAGGRQCKPRPAEPGNKTADGPWCSASTRIRLGGVGASSSV
jgi:hypothetical protein